MEPPTGRPGQIPDLNFTFSSLDAGLAGDKRFHDVSRKEPRRRAQKKRRNRRVRDVVRPIRRAHFNHAGLRYRD